MLSESELKFAEAQRVAHLATAEPHGAPHVVPVCFAISGPSLYVAIDQKPKSGDPRRLKRLRNIIENPAVAVVIDRYDEDWTRLGWVMVRGKAEILTIGPEKAGAHSLLRVRYLQYREMVLNELPVIAVRMERVTSWGELAVGTA